MSSKKKTPEKKSKKKFSSWKKKINHSLNFYLDFIKYPVLTKKTRAILSKLNQHTFDVDPRLSKPQIKKLFEKFFNVDVIAINTHIPPRKKRNVRSIQGYKPQYKRAIITLKKDQSLNYNLINKDKKNNNDNNE